MAESPSELQSEIEKLERKQAENPEGRYFVPLANDYRKIGDLDRAEGLLREGLRKHPDYLSAHIVLGRCLADRDKTAEAADEFTYVLSMDPQNLIALRSLGELALADGRREDAARWYRELLAVDPMNDEARQALAQLEAPADTAGVPAIGDDGAWWDAGGQSTDDSPETTFEPASEPQQVTVPETSGDSQGWAREDDQFGEFLDIEPHDQPSYGSGAGGDRGLDERAFDDESSSEMDDDAGSVDVVTETIAELYARQGLHDRAAEVYRELIRRRGGDPVLEARLAEVERQTAGGGDEADPFADSFAAGFEEQPLTPASGAGAHDAGEVQDRSAQAVGSGTIAEYLTRLANWSPPATGSDAAPADYDLPGDREIPAEREPIEATSASTGAADAAEPFPWELPGDEQPPGPSGTPPASASVPDPADAGFGSLSRADEPSQEPEPSIELADYFPAEPIEPVKPAEPVASAERPKSAEPPGTSADHDLKAPTDQVGSGGEEDDDLESFQAWLRSLKR